MRVSIEEPGYLYFDDVWVGSIDDLCLDAEQVIRLKKYFQCAEDAFNELDFFQDCMKYNCEDTGSLTTTARRILKRLGRL